MKTTVGDAVYVGETLTGQAYLDVLDRMIDGLGVGFQILGEKFQFKFAPPEPGEGHTDEKLCWLKLYDVLGYCHLVSYTVRSRLLEDPNYVLTVSQIDVDAINVGGALLARAAEFAGMVQQEEAGPPPEQGGALLN